MKNSTITISSLRIVGAFISTTVMVHAVDLSPLANQIIAIRKELVSAIDVLSKGQREIHKIYQDGASGLKPQLIDQLDKLSKQTKGKVKDIRGSLDPLKKLPPFVKKIAMKLANLDDLEPTLLWIADKPLKVIIDYLQETYTTFNALGEKIRSGSKESAKLDQHFTNAITKLQKAVCRIEKTLASLKDDYVISEQCKK